MPSTSGGPGLLCVGAVEIGRFVGAKPRQICHLADAHQLPVFRTGRLLCARKSDLLQWINDRAGAGANA